MAFNYRSILIDNNEIGIPLPPQPTTSKLIGKIGAGEDKSSKTTDAINIAMKDSNAENAVAIYRPIGLKWEDDVTALSNTPNDFLNTSQLVLVRQFYDAQRMGKFLKSPKGISFILLQQSQQLMNPNTEHYGIINQTRIFNPGKFLLQIAGAGSGVHIPRHGVSFEPTTYGEVAKESNFNGFAENNNRLIKISKALSLNDPKDPKYFTLRDGQVIPYISSWGGPKSIGGIGTTTYRVSMGGIPVQQALKEEMNRKQQTTDDYVGLIYTSDLMYIDNEEKLNVLFNYTNELINDPSFIPGKSETTKETTGGIIVTSTTSRYMKNMTTYDQLQQFVNDNSADLPSANKIVDKILQNGTEIDISATSTTHENIHSKYGVAGAVNERKDKINLIRSDEIVDDLVLFKFNNLQFRAFLDGISDKFSPSHEGVKYIGRPDEVFVYTGMNRSLSFNFTIWANSAEEMPIIYWKLNRLVQFVSPSYTSSGAMIGPFVKLTIGDWCRDLPGYIESLDYSIDDNFPWETGNNNQYNMYQMPHGVKVSTSFRSYGHRLPNSAGSYFDTNNKYGNWLSNTFDISTQRKNNT